MSAADASSLNWWSWVYFIGAWLVAIGVIMEGAEIVSRRAAKRKFRSFIGPLQHPLSEPPTPSWAHTFGDIGFLILVSALVIEQVAHQRMERITERESDRLTKQLDSTMWQAAVANAEASQARKEAGAAIERASLTESNNLALRSNIIALELWLEPRQFEIMGSATFLQRYRGTNAVIVCGICPDCTELAGQIRTMLQLAGWNVDPVSITTHPVPAGVMVAPCLENQEFENLVNFGTQAYSVLNELQRHGIDSEIKIFGGTKSKKRFNGVFIVVGAKPTPDEAEAMRIKAKLKTATGDARRKLQEAAAAINDRRSARILGTNIQGEINFIPYRGVGMEWGNSDDQLP